MQEENALLYTGPAIKVGNRDLTSEGQVLFPVVRFSKVHAPKKHGDNLMIDLRLFIPVDDVADEGWKRDVSWLLPGGANCQLRDVQVLLIFKEGTFTMLEQPS